MIVKKMPTSQKAARQEQGANVRALADYIAGPGAGGEGEKVEHRGALNLLNIDHDGQVQEMIDLAEIAKRSPQPVQHWIISWRETSSRRRHRPTRRSGCSSARWVSPAPSIYAFHRDTNNWHLHVAVNRVNPETEKVVTVNKRFDHEIAHRAIARIEQGQRWQRRGAGPVPGPRRRRGAASHDQRAGRSATHGARAGPREPDRGEVRAAGRHRAWGGDAPPSTRLGPAPFPTGRAWHALRAQGKRRRPLGRRCRGQGLDGRSRLQHVGAGEATR